MNDKLDAILKAFADYIRDHNSFDIVYSEKIGYVKLQVPHPDKEVPEVMATPEILLDALFLEIVNDVVFSPDNPRHDDLAMTEYEETESRHRITAILETMENGDKTRYLDFLDTYIKKYQDSGTRMGCHDGE